MDDTAQADTPDVPTGEASPQVAAPSTADPEAPAVASTPETSPTPDAGSPVEEAGEPAPDDSTDAVTDESGPDLPSLPVTPTTAQFPAVDGTTEGAEREIAQRTHDGQSTGRFVKEFRLGRLAPADDDPCHATNAVAVVQDAAQRGLHPYGDVYLTSVTEHDEPLNAAGTRREQWTSLTYEVDVVPASVDPDPSYATTPTVIALARGGDRVDASADDVGDTG